LAINGGPQVVARTVGSINLNLKKFIFYLPAFGNELYNISLVMNPEYPFQFYGGLSNV